MRAPILLASLLATAALAMAKPAEASTGYPQAISEALTMPCAPPCIICHATNAGGKGTIVTQFGKTAMTLGLTGGEQLDLLRTTLQKMAQMGINSDADPEIDTDELTVGTDPSVVGGDVCNGPKYGCGASTIVAVPPRRSGDPAAAVAAVLTALAGVLLMRRRRH